MEKWQQAAETFKLLGNPTRLRILAELYRGGCSVKEICRQLQLPQATVSQHLALLRNKQIVTAERRGVMVCYSLSDRNIVKVLIATGSLPGARRKK